MLKNRIITLYLHNNNNFTGWVVSFFLILFVLKLMGVYVHYYPSKGGVSNVWIAISLLVVFLNYVVIHGMETPNIFRGIAVLLSLVFSFLFIVHLPFINLFTAKHVNLSPWIPGHDF